MYREQKCHRRKFNYTQCYHANEDDADDIFIIIVQKFIITISLYTFIHCFIILLKMILFY